MQKFNKPFKTTLLFILILTIICCCGFFLWASDYYPAEDTAIALMQEHSSLQVNDNLTILSPDLPSNTGIVFYPGAKVDEIAYLPILEKLRIAGYTCILVKMPFHMAVFDSDAATQVFDELPEIKSWYMAGHSMGGAMASDYASKHPDQIEGLILMGAYLYGDYPPEKTLTIYGTFNANLEENIDYTDNIVKIEGGNHAQFGNYGKQKGDPDATISAEEQQTIAVNAIIDFINL